MMLAKNYDLLVLVSKKLSRRMRKNPTRAEWLFWNAVRNRRFLGLKFLRQHPLVVGQRGSFVADFYCHELKLVVELDGAIHDTTKEEDVVREQLLQGLGISIIRFKNEQIESNIDGALKTIERLAKNRNPPPSLQREGGRGDEFP